MQGLESLSAAGKLYLEVAAARKDSTRSGSQVFEVSPPVSDTDTVGQPLHHRWAAQCSTAEAVFIDDIPPAHGS